MFVRAEVPGPLAEATGLGRWQRLRAWAAGRGYDTGDWHDAKKNRSAIFFGDTNFNFRRLGRPYGVPFHTAFRSARTPCVRPSP